MGDFDCFNGRGIGFAPAVRDLTRELWETASGTPLP